MPLGVSFYFNLFLGEHVKIELIQNAMVLKTRLPLHCDNFKSPHPQEKTQVHLNSDGRS